MKLIQLLLLTIPMIQAANYTAQKTTVDSIEVVKLTDEQRHIVVTVVPSMGNNSYSMTVNGKEIFYSPAQSLAGALRFDICRSPGLRYAGGGD